MSLCVIIQDKERIIIGADSRESIKIDNEYFATGMYAKKTRIIGNQVIFTTGNSYVSSMILDEYEKSRDYTIENLEKIKDKHVGKYVSEHGEKFFNNGFELRHVIAIVVCFRHYNKNMIYSLSSENSEIIKIIDESVRIADGTKSKEALQLLKGYRDMEVLQAYRTIYNELSDECIGGELTIYLIDRYGIRSVTYPILDSRKIRIAPQNVMWSREHGMVIEREDHASKAIFNSDEIAFFVNGERKLWLDVQNETYMFSGTLKAANGIFSGDLSAVGGTFTGTLMGVDGTFSGTLSAGRVEGSDIVGAFIQGGEIYGTSINGGSVTGATVRTSNIGNARVELRSGLADIGVFSSAPGNPNIFGIVDNYNSATISLPGGGDIIANSRDLEISAIDGRIEINAPDGVFINGSRVG